jgi:hypothetical protein
MKNLEEELRRQPLLAPSKDLDERVLAQRPRPEGKRSGSPWRVPLWGTAAVGIVMGLGGFVAGFSWRGNPPKPDHGRQPPITIQVIYDSPVAGNPFDFTRAADFFPAENLKTTTRTPPTTI